MVLSALVDVGVPVAALDEALRRLGVSGVALQTQVAQRGGVMGTFLQVDLDTDAQRTRSFDDFIALVRQSSLSDRVKRDSTAIFQRMASAESRVHRTQSQHLHLHELGTLDTLVDVVGAVVGLEFLGVARVFSSPVPMGSGVFRSAHGVLPVPSPATAALFTMADAPVVPAPGNPARTGEMVTPTGAGIITTLAEFRQPGMEMRAHGYGLGSRDPQEYPNALGIWLGDLLESQPTGGLTLIETNLDDTTGEVLGYVHERLFEMGARDVWFIPIQMKKNRPATMMCAIVDAQDEHRAVELILRETTTLGVRVRPITRHEADRESRTVETRLGPASVKLKILDGQVVSASPEYEECRLIAQNSGLPIAEVMRIVQQAFDSQVPEIQDPLDG